MSSLPAAAHGDPLSLLSNAALDGATGKLGTGMGMKTRRLSASASASSHRRRMSDARDGAPVKILSPSLKPKTPALISALVKAPAPALPVDGSMPDSPSSPAFKNPDLSGGSGGLSGRRKGTVFRCESCSKVYRHPSCLIKHRWEHSPHWAESSKLLLSKHQQVQLLEGAAILSNFQVGSLPEDRALWPTWATSATSSLPGSTGMLDAIAGGMEGSAIDDSDEEEPREEDTRPRSRSMGAAAMLKRRPVKAGFTPPAHAKVTQVAPGVLLAPSAPAPVPIKQHQTRSRGAPASSPVEVRPGVLAVDRGSEPIAIKREAFAASTSPTSALDALASLTLSLSASVSSYSASYARSSVRSGSEEDPELPELDEHPEEDDVPVSRKEDVWDGMDVDLDEMEM